MKNKLKSNPFFYTAIVLFSLFAVLIAFGIGMFYYVFAIPEPEGLSLATWPNTFTDNFSIWLEYEDGKVHVEEIGLDRLDEYGLWLQILDESGQEIFSHNKPTSYPEQYSMSELVSLSKSEYENEYTVFVSRFDTSDTTLNYIVGFPYSIGKYMLYYNGENISRLSPFAKSVVLLAGCAVILCGFLYSLWLSRNLSVMIRSIRNVSQRSYKPMKETGVFGEVYGSLNKMDMEMQRSTQIQEETDRTRKEWISNITHDLKTPLSPIKGYAELLTNGSDLDNQTVQNYGEIILKNTNHIEKLMNDLKLTYQLEAGAFPYTPQNIRIVRFLKELVIDIINDPAFSERVIEFESDMQEATAKFDPNLLRRAIQNIVVNALVHNPSDTKVKITVNRAQNDRFTISICDNGNGMSETELSNLWNRYYRGTSTKEKPEGSGLGLAIAKQIITLHDGDITVKSEPGVGTEFIINLPLETGQFDN